MYEDIVATTKLTKDFLKAKPKYIQKISDMVEEALQNEKNLQNNLDKRNIYEFLDEMDDWLKKEYRNSKEYLEECNTW